MNKIKLGLYIFLLTFIAMGCDKDDDDDTTQAPVIETWELGYDNSEIGYAGADLHIEAQILADAKVSTIQVTIHPEGEHKQLASEEFEIDTTYTKFSGIINPTFHEHIDIPTTADTGHYHFHFIVTDMAGRVTAKETELHVLYPTDTEAPVITISSAPAENQTFAIGDVIRIQGQITDNLALGGIYIGLVRENQNLTDAQITASNTITLLHTHDFAQPATYTFDAQITVGAAQDNNPTPSDLTTDLDGGAAWQSGNYYLVVKSPDKFGGGVSFSTHYPIILNLN